MINGADEKQSIFYYEKKEPKRGIVSKEKQNSQKTTQALFLKSQKKLMLLKLIYFPWKLLLTVVWEKNHQHLQK